MTGATPTLEAFTKAEENKCRADKLYSALPAVILGEWAIWLYSDYHHEKKDAFYIKDMCGKSLTHFMVTASKHQHSRKKINMSKEEDHDKGLLKIKRLNITESCFADNAPMFVKVKTPQVWVPSFLRVPSPGSSTTSVRSQESVLRTAVLEPAPNWGLDLSLSQAESRRLEPVF